MRSFFFKDALHTPFRVHVEGARSVDLTLIDVVESDSPPGWEAFSLLFDGPDPPAFWDGLFTVEHPELGSSAMYLAAVHTEGGGQRYEAVFNRPTA